MLDTLEVQAAEVWTAGGGLAAAHVRVQRSA